MTPDETLPERCCGTCLWWSNTAPPLATGKRRPVGADPAIGTCQAFPPTIVRAPGFWLPMFPEVHETRTCRDWEASLDDDDPERDEEDVPEEQADNVVPMVRAA